MPDITPLLHGDPHEAGGYHLEGRLGAGGQGVVYLGRKDGGEPVAVKLLRADWTADEENRRYFAREIAAARQVAPFCVAQVLDADPDAAQPYVVTEYIAGPSLQRAGTRSGPDLHRLAVATATALAAVHEAGIVHRDFKPGNVLLGPDGPRVIDFGIARALEGAATLSSRIVGTPAYMAPEQLAGSGVGPASDVFAWGGVIVYAASGRPPFGDDALPAVMHRILTAPPDLGPLTEPLRSIVADALDKDPAARPTMIDIHLRLLGRALPAARPPSPGAVAALAAGPFPATGPAPATGLSPAAGPPAPTEPVGGRERPHRRRRGVILGAALSVLAVGVSAAVLVPSLGGGAHGTASTPGPAAPATPTRRPSTPPATTAAPAPVTTPIPEQSTPQPEETAIPAKPTEPAASPRPTSADPTPAASGFPADFAGVWRGRVKYDPGATDSLVLTIREGGATVTDEFQEYRCTGTSRLVRINGDTATLKRVGMRGDCVRDGMITLTRQADGRLEFAFSGYGENKVTRKVHFTIDGVLNRDS
ncbi:serine/threonine protein kinase [Sphaerisporangium corydalis]|uniref:Serine/threonine protein kinase n=1 Tax=Sphaerisporangium corydalis TaxID=1441875 RepID=A0ABV9E6T3_9ACTN|nr:serine/threonine-protein kinase [Sphaerisporangium corydalis]